VIVIIPIMVMAPTAAIHVPPSVVLSPAALPCLVKFTAPVIRLPAVVSMMLDGFVELVIRRAVRRRQSLSSAVARGVPTNRSVAANMAATDTLFPRGIEFV